MMFTNASSMTAPKASLNKIICTYKIRRSLADLLNCYVDLYLARRIAKRSREFNQKLQGKMVIFAHDYIGVQINLHGFFEKSALDMVFAFIDPVLGDIESGAALDIGANIGNHSLYFSQYFSSVYAFEPHPRIHELLLINARIASNIRVFNLGFGEEVESLDLTENWENMGSASFKHSWSADSSKVRVKIGRLDDFDFGAGEISFMKIDVEGFESSVIRGAQSTIRKHQPLIVMEQLHSEFVNGSTESIQLLLNEGYTFCWYQPWAFSRGWLKRRINTVRNLLLGGTYDYNFITGPFPPPATYEMLIAVPQRFQRQLLSRR